MKAKSLPGLPAIVLEELTHILFAAPYASRIEVLLHAQPPLTLTWRQGTPMWWIHLAHLAPTLLGLLGGLTALLFVPSPVEVVTPNPFLGGALVLLVAYNWVMYTWPSHEDRNPFGGEADG